MLCLDSIKIGCNNSLIADLDGSKFLQQITLNSNKDILTDRLITPTDLGILGLKRIEQTENQTTVELSAKILDLDYSRGINKETIEKALSKIRYTGLIDFNIQDVIAGSTVYKIDVTDNLKVSHPKENYVEVLNTYRQNTKYKVQDYDKSSVNFRKRVKTKKFKQYLTFYDKQVELKPKEYEDDSRLFKDVYDSFKDVLRVESKLQSVTTIRKQLDLQKGVILLTDVLNSRVKVNYNVFSEIVDKQNNLQVVDRSELSSRHFDNSIAGHLLEYFIHTHNYDIEVVSAWLKSLGKSYTPYYRYMTRAKKIIEQYQRRKHGQSRKTLITELRKLLQAA